METDDMEIDLMKYVDIVRRWLWLVVIGTLLAGGTALAVSLVLPPVYQAEADVASVKSLSQITLAPNYQTVSEAQLTQGLNVSDRQKALVAIAQSNEVVNTVIAQLGSSLTPEERQPATLIGMVKVTTTGDLIQIQVQNRDPRKAASIATAWASAFIDRVNPLYADSPTSLQQVQTQADQAFQSYQKAETALTQFIGNNQIDDLTRQIAQKQNTLSDLYSTHRNLDRLLQDSKSLQDLLSKDTSVTPNDASNRLAALLLRANAATVSYGSTPIQLQLTAGALTDSTVSNVRDQVNALIAALQTRQQQVQSQLADPTLQNQVLALQKQLEQQNTQKQDLTNARDLAWSTYKTLASKVEELKVSQESTGTIVRMASSAVVPDRPISPSKTRNALLAAVVGLMLSVGIVFAIEFLDASVRSPRELAGQLGLPVFELAAETGASVNQNATPSPAPMYYRLWASLFGKEVWEGCTLLVVSSEAVGSDPGESSSASIAANLGVVAAQSGRSVILVDADVAQPSLDRMFGLTNARGWSQLLGDQRESASYVQPTSIKNLSIVSAGPAGSSVEEQIVSPRLAQVIADLKARANLIIFVSAPHAVSAHAILLAKEMEGALLVVTQGVTPRDAALQLKDQLLSVKTNVLGVVLFEVGGRKWGLNRLHPQTVSSQKAETGSTARTTVEA